MSQQTGYVAPVTSTYLQNPTYSISQQQQQQQQLLLQQQQQHQYLTPQIAYSSVPISHGIPINPPIPSAVSSFPHTNLPIQPSYQYPPPTQQTPSMNNFVHKLLGSQNSSISARIGTPPLSSSASEELSKPIFPKAGLIPQIKFTTESIST